ncbi:MAG: hypothetical protein ABIP03_14605 [Aquihabitans sp.]
MSVPVEDDVVFNVVGTGPMFTYSRCFTLSLGLVRSEVVDTLELCGDYVSTR